MVPGGSSAYLLVDDQRQPIKPLEVLMKRYLGAVAAAGLLVGTMAVATDALAAGHGGGGGGFGAATWAVGSAGHCWKASLRCHHRSSIHRVHTLCLPRPRPQSRRQARAQYLDLGMAETILNFQKNYEQAPSRDFQPLRHVI